MTTSTRTPAATLTAGQVAQYIRRPDEPLSAAIARFRNWEKTGVIKATGDSNPGTGRKKQYQPDAVLRAVLLQTLVDTFGSSAISLTELTNEIGGLIGRTRWAHESELIVLSKPRGLQQFAIATVKPGQLRNYISERSVADIHVVINVKDLFDRIDIDWRKKFYSPRAFPRRPSTTPSKASMEKSEAFRAAIEQIEKQFGKGSVTLPIKPKPES